MLTAKLIQLLYAIHCGKYEFITYLKIHVRVWLVQTNEGKQRSLSLDSYGNIILKKSNRFLSASAVLHYCQFLKNLQFQKSILASQLPVASVMTDKHSIKSLFDLDNSSF